jgi:quinohemoprotein ethanol dehydrogenase
VPVPDPLPPIQPVPRPPVENTGTPEEIAHGAQLWRNCAACHTNMPRTLSADLLRMSADTHAQFNDIVLRGARRDRMMPQWDDILSEQDANDIHAYLIDQAWTAYEKGQEEEQIRTTVH